MYRFHVRIVKCVFHFGYERTVLNLTCDAILFDLDGVLIDSNHFYEEHWRIWANRRGVSYDHILEVHHGRPARETIRIVAPDLNAQSEAEAFRDELIRSNLLKQVRPFPHVLPLLTDLPPNRWAIATSAPRTSALNMLYYAEIPLPKIIICGDDVDQGKPAPDPYLQAASGLDCRIDQCVVIEDAPAGIRSGQSAGAYVIAVQTTHKRSHLHKADTIVNCIADLHIENTGNHLQITSHSTKY